MLLQRIESERPHLSRGLEAVARYVEQHVDDLAGTRIQDVAARCGVQPSAVVRFAQRMGYSGFHQLKRELHARGSAGAAVSARYRERIPAQSAASAAEVAHSVVDAASASLLQLRRDLQASTIGDAVDLLAEASCWWIAGSGRSCAVAALLAYTLQQFDKPVQWLDRAGPLHEGQLRGMRRADALVVAGQAPHAAESLLAVQTARHRGCSVIAITDERAGPLAREADVVLHVEEGSVLGLRPLTQSLTVAQALLTALAHRLESEDPRHD